MLLVRQIVYYYLVFYNRTLFLYVSVHGVAVAQGAKAGSAWRWSAAPACLHCHVAEARLLDSCLAQPYEAGPAEPTVGLLTSGPIGWRSKVVTITALAGKLFDKLL